MLDIIFKTKFIKINDSFFPNNIYAGILYNSKREPIDKIMFYKTEEYAFEFWNDACYSFSKDSLFYVDDIVDLSELFIESFGSNMLNLS